MVLVSNDTTLTVGETAILACVSYSSGDEEITWSLNGQTVINSSLHTIYEEEVTQGGKVFKQSFLQLCGLTVSDAGGYTCLVREGQSTDNATITLNVSGE